MNNKITLASTNKHKIKEFQKIFNEFDIIINGLPDNLKYEAPQENGNTFFENADIKSKYYSNIIDSLVIADDSGLCVKALDEKPGIYSARFAGNNATDKDNNLKLLSLMKDINTEKRQARFVCALSLAKNGKIIDRVLGEVNGVILDELKGHTGFGYDPLFYYPSLNKTFAEMNNNEKNEISHRFNACQKIIPIIKSL